MSIEENQCSCPEQGCRPKVCVKNLTKCVYPCLNLIAREGTFDGVPNNGLNSVGPNGESWGGIFDAANPVPLEKDGNGNIVYDGNGNAQIIPHDTPRGSVDSERFFEMAQLVVKYGIDIETCNLPTICFQDSTQLIDYLYIGKEFFYGRQKGPCESRYLLQYQFLVGKNVCSSTPSCC